MNVTGISAAGWTACSLGATAVAETFSDPIDPADRLGTFIQGGGSMGGGGARFDFHTLFPYYRTHPYYAPPSVKAICTVVERHNLMDALFKGAIFYETREVAGWKMPELLALCAVSAPVDNLVRLMDDVNSWAEWMPRFISSQSRPGVSPGTQLQEARMRVAKGVKVHYQVMVKSAPLGDGRQIHWRLDEGRFKKDPFWSGTLGLRINNGSCTFVPAPNRVIGTIMAYSIHTQTIPFVPRTASLIMETTILEFPDFPSSLTSRDLDPTWTTGRPYASAMQPFAMRPVT